MSNKFKICLTGLSAAAVIFGSLICIAPAVKADSKIKIDEKHFPDKVFRDSLKKDYFDKNHDGYLSSSEIKEINDYRNAESGIKDLKGIEYLTSLQCLVIYGNELTSVDLSKNTKLSELWIENNKLESLDLSKNTNLDFLHCGGNLFDSIDLSNNPKLDTLTIDNSHLKSIDLSNQKDLGVIYLQNNELTSLDISHCSNLWALSVKGNKLKELDVSMFPRLMELICSDNEIGTLNVSGCSKLRTLKCINNKLTELDISDNSALEDLRCQGNSIAKLNISNNKNIISAFSCKETVKKGYSVYRDKWEEYYFSVDDKTTVATVSCFADGVEAIGIECGSVLTVDFKNATADSVITVKSSDESVLKVNKNNSLVALKAGISTVTATCNGNEYTFTVNVLYKDVTDANKFWYEPTYALTEKGVVKGYDNQTMFKPANKCTRAQMVTFIWRLMGSPEPKNKDCSFSDVKKGDYFYKACIWGNENHIVEGYKDGTFGPQIVCARRHAVTFLWRLAGKPEPAGDKTKFSDVFKDIDEDDYFFKATIWATEQKIVAGYSDNTFRPNDDCLRRQMVTFLYKYDKFVNSKS